MPDQPREIVVPASLWMKLVLIGAAVLFLGLGSLVLVGLFARILALIFLAVSIAAALSPIVEQLQRRIPRTLAIILVYLVLVLLFAGLITLVVPSLVAQAQNLIDRVPEVFDRIETWIGQQGWVSSDSLFDAAVSQIQRIGTEIISFPLTLFSALLDFTLVVIISVYMLIEAENTRRFALSLFPESQRQSADNVATEMLEAAGGFVRGVAINIVIIGTVTYVGLSIIGVDFALVLGILAGLLEVIPIAGPIIAAIPAIAIALLQSPTTAVITAVFVLIVQQFEGNILTPNIMHSQAKVSPLLVLIAVFAGSAVGGIVGALVAIPLVAALRVFVIRVIAPAIRPTSTAASDG